jgi:hypothetical protein
MPNKNEKKEASNAFSGGIAAHSFAEDFISFYANTLRAGLTPFDFLLSFGHIVVRGSNTIAEDKYEIRMSPQFFKMTIAQMMATLTAYEQQYGEISSFAAQQNDIVDGLRNVTASHAQPKP